MKKHSLRTFLIVLLALTVTPVIVSAQNASNNSAEAGSHGDRSAIEGVWDGIGTPVRCDTGEPTGPTFQVMFMFNRGGTMTEITTNLRRSPSVGTWRHLDGRSYTAVDRLFRFNPNDSFAGRSVITADFELSEGGDEFTSTSFGEVFNADNELIGTFCTTVTATRLE